MLKAKPGRYGHLFIGLSRPSGSPGGPHVWQGLVHRLIAETFLGPIPKGMVVMHLDHDAGNNSVANLRIGTQRENIDQMHAAGRYVNGMRKKTHCPRGHPYEGANLYVTKAGARQCRACGRARRLEAAARRREAAVSGCR